MSGYSLAESQSQETLDRQRRAREAAREETRRLYPDVPNVPTDYAAKLRQAMRDPLTKVVLLGLGALVVVAIARR